MTREPGPAGAIKGRGADGNPANRFASEVAEPFDDGWGTLDDRGPGPVPTTVTADSARSAITYNASPDIPFDRSVNPYKGCEHGCPYCFARPTHEYLGLSIGLDFETKILAKHGAAEALARELNAARYSPRLLALGVNTDAYQPVERELMITRRILEVLDRHGHPVLIITKSALVLRDLDLLESMARRRLVLVYVSVTTLDRGLSRALEPRAAAPHRRLEAIAGLARAGIPVGVLAAPMIPALNDAELEAILAAASRAGATYGRYGLLRLPHGVKDLFADWLARHAPDKRSRVLSQIRAIRGGRLNDPAFGGRFTGHGPYADMLAQRYCAACRRHRLDQGGWEPDLTRFRKAGQERQAALDL
jgi:DNA repair photolyase